MPLIPIPDAAGQKIWVERLAPHTWIVLDQWDSTAKEYLYHELEEPHVQGRISAGVLEARYRAAGVPDSSLDQPARPVQRRRPPDRPETTPLQHRRFA